MANSKPRSLVAVTTVYARPCMLRSFCISLAKVGDEARIEPAPTLGERERFRFVIRSRKSREASANPL